VAGEYQYESKPLPDPGLGRFGLGDPTQFSTEGFFSPGQPIPPFGGADPNAVTVPPSGTGSIPDGTEWRTVRDCDDNEFQVLTRAVPT
jgi:hypothetical protein